MNSCIQEHIHCSLHAWVFSIFSILHKHYKSNRTILFSSQFIFTGESNHLESNGSLIICPHNKKITDDTTLFLLRHSVSFQISWICLKTRISHLLLVIFFSSAFLKIGFTLQSIMHLRGLTHLSHYWGFRLWHKPIDVCFPDQACYWILFMSWLTSVTKYEHFFLARDLDVAQTL